MNHAHIKAILEGVVPEVKTAIDAAVGPLTERVGALEQRAVPDRGEKGDPGERGEAGVRGEKGEPGERGDVGPPGGSGPAGEKGEPGERGDAGACGEKGEPGERGEKGDPGPAGEIGPKGDKGDPGERGEAGARGEKGEPGDRGDEGVIGPRGEKGERGEAGRDASDLAVIMDIAGKQAVAALTKALDTFAVTTADGGRTFEFRFTVGEVEVSRTLKTALPLDKGVWREGEFEPGDGVSLGGNFWIAQVNTAARPAEGKDWRLAVRHGRNGKDYRPDDRPKGEPVRLS